LQEHYPDWHWRINLDKFNINDPCLCVLGQVHERLVGKGWLDSGLRLSGYSSAESIYGQEWLEDHGFFLPDGFKAALGGKFDPAAPMSDEWWVLQELWMETIKRLRKVRAKKEAVTCA